MKYIDVIRFDSRSIAGYMDRYSWEDYPCRLLFDMKLRDITCSDVTILYGNNGSGKSTILNLIVEKIGCSRKNKLYKHTMYGSSIYVPFDGMVDCMEIETVLDEYGRRNIDLPYIKRLITSDDIFKELENTIINNKKSSEEMKNAIEDKYDIIEKAQDDNFRYRCMADYDRMMQVKEAYKNSDYKYAIKHTTKRAYKLNSNGETALMYFDNIFENDGIYLLDEPENCLSPIFQLKLMEIIEYVSKYCGCQFIIATHSPLILSLNDAKIYNLDKRPVEVNKWNELGNVKLYYEFFKKREKEFN